LEPLLINPIPRGALVVGKWLATVVLSTSTVLLTLAVTLVVLSHVPLEAFNVRFSVTAGDVGWLVVIAIPIALLASAAQLGVATFARSYKEAQAYLSYMIFVPTLPGVLLSVVPLQSELWMAAVPIFGQQVLLIDVIRGEPLSAAGVLIAALVATVCASLCLWGTAALFRREQTIFGR
jgi:sodium transport system permease protein